MSEQKRKIGKIVFDRPPFKWGRFSLFAGLGLLIGILVGGLFWLLLSRHAGEIAPAYQTKDCWPYLIGSACVGLLAGIVFGWGWKRAVTARIEMVDPPQERRRPSTSTAIARVDISGRSRF